MANLCLSLINCAIKIILLCLTKLRTRQRGYIHGLSKKLCIDEYSNLPFYVKDIRMLTVAQAGEVIDILKDEADGGGIF